jgi:phosphatidylglycerophosphate synthase
MLFNIKGRIENKIAPIARHIPLSPNTITILSIISMAFAGYHVTNYHFVYAGILVFVSGFLDILDGAVAKANNRATEFGNFFDKFADRLNDMIIISSVIVAGLVSIYLGLFVLLVIVLASYSSAVVESITKTNIGSVLSMRGLRILIIAAGLISNNILIMMAVLAVLGVLALGDRILNAAKLLRH